jgi:hypothetical protein
MGVIFKDITDDQQEAMMETTYIGLTWQMRYLRVKYITYAILGSVVSAAATASADYALFKFTDYSGIIGWLLS